MHKLELDIKDINNLIYEQPKILKKSFFWFMLNLKLRSKKYCDAFYFFGFIIIMTMLVYIIPAKNAESYLKAILIGLFFCLIFISGQFFEFSKCFYIEDDSIFLCIRVKNKIYYLAQRDLKELSDIVKDEEFNCYRLIFNSGMIKFTLVYCEGDNRFEDLKRIVSYSQKLTLKINHLMK